jgi:hypothetical protein
VKEARRNKRGASQYQPAPTNSKPGRKKTEEEKK